MRKKLAYFLLTFCFLLETTGLADCYEDPLFPGTLLQYSAKVIEPGHFALQPYLLFTREYGRYDKSSNLKKIPNIYEYELFLFLKVGLIKNIDIELIANGAYAHSSHGDFFLYGDTLLLCGIQLMRAEKTNRLPDVKLLIGENFPTGKYKDLDPEANGIDGSGLGTYETFFVLSAARVIHLFHLNPINLNLNLYYILPTATKVSGFSVYGGGIGTKGVVDPGERFIGNFAIEYSLNRRWNLGIDIRCNLQNASGFHASSDNFGPPAALPSSELYSLAPCIEYNPNKNFGINCGVWFSYAGRNADAFTIPIFSFFYYF